MRHTDSVAFEAAAALEAYEVQLQVVCERGPDLARVSLVQRELRRVCRCCLGLPQLAGASTALLLAHHRLLLELARLGSHKEAALRAAVLREVEQSVTALRRGCRALFVAPHLQ